MTRDAEYRRLAAEAEDLLRVQAALLENPDLDVFEVYVHTLKMHMVKLAAYLAAQPARN